MLIVFLSKNQPDGFTADAEDAGWKEDKSRQVRGRVSKQLEVDNKFRDRIRGFMEECGRIAKILTVSEQGWSV